MNPNAPAAAPWPPPAPWAPPSETEHLLHEAGLRGDVPGQLRALAGAELYIPAPRAEADADPETVTWRVHRDPAGFACRPVLTRGMLPAWHPDWVFHGVSLRWAAEFGWSDPRLLLGVNVGTPAQLLLPTGPADLALWRRSYAETDRPRKDRLLALRHGALRGPLAYGLACGAHLAVGNAVPWNEVGTLYRAYVTERDLLRESWGITTREEWQRQLAFLLDADNSPPEPEFVLRAREQLTAAAGGLPSADLWRETAAGHAQDLGADPAAVRGIEDLVRRVLRYEARFRADGLLPPDGRVRTTVAYDYGRAVNLARWGLSARFGTPAEAEQAIVHAGALSRSAHRSWEDFSAAYAMGRVLRFDEEEYGPFYEQNVLAHRLLTESEGSPWRHLPWR
ncbi:hypothetical protein EES43_20150 [Streptomyces sp. ADI96-02]|uniref:DUF1266 domain-containing protein n=1 Tax=unclassified Streptomyces TaxID=2593676 RepID=UPI000F5595ED|nr:DUF1266 domain-containing protein [Streptomyces sp. ADI96-02]RPK58180.1 hypothetical protein EES43_20150 [Streptomyces sp. ADI96-02]